MTPLDLLHNKTGIVSINLVFEEQKAEKSLPSLIDKRRQAFTFRGTTLVGAISTSSSKHPLCSL
jgi:hypothetical protein